MTDTNSEPKVIELDPAIWLRGEGNGQLLTFRGDQRRQCCIGIACTVLGVPDSELAGAMTLDDLDPSRIAEMDVASIAKVTVDPDDGYEWVSDALTSVYLANDRGTHADEARIANINAELARLNAPFRFVLKAQAA